MTAQRFSLGTGDQEGVTGTGGDLSYLRTAAVWGNHILLFGVPRAILIMA